MAQVSQILHFGAEQENLASLTSWVEVLVADYKEMGVSDWMEMPSYLLVVLLVTLWLVRKAISKNYFNKWRFVHNEAEALKWKTASWLICTSLQMIENLIGSCLLDRCPVYMAIMGMYILAHSADKFKKKHNWASPKNAMSPYCKIHRSL